MGHEVRLVTSTPGPDPREWPFEVVRRCGWLDLMKAFQWCDLLFQNSISLQTAWPRLLVRRPWVIAHQMWIARLDGTLGWQDRLKRSVLRHAANVSISRAVAAALNVPSVIIGNPYQDAVFLRTGADENREGLVFLGRLVSDKGADVLLRALAILRARNVTPRLTLVGSGPEEPNLRRLVLEFGLREQVDFVGAQSGAALADILNRREILVVPSRWAEPFGIVALEGIACGCVVVGSADGGLPDAIGPCGVTFPNGDAVALASELESLLADKERIRLLREGAAGHLARHTARAVAAAYIEVFQKAMETPGS